MYRILVPLLMMSSVALAASTPFPPWLQKFFDMAPVQNGIGVQRTARAVYDVAVHGGSVGDHGLGVFLPAKAVITRSYLRIDTSFTDVGSATVALSCEDANNIKTATDFTGLSGLVEGESTGAASAFKQSIANKCEITATVAGGLQSTGKATVWVDYVAHN